MPTLPRTQAAPTHVAPQPQPQPQPQGVRRSSPVTSRVPGRPLAPALTQNYLTDPSTSRQRRLGALSADRRPATATFASNNAIPPRAASQVGLGREYAFQGYRTVSSDPSLGGDTDRTSPERQQNAPTRARLASCTPSFGPNPVRTPRSGHVFGKGRSTSPIKPSLDRPAGTGWASGIVRTERERTRVGSFANIPYEVRFPSPRFAFVTDQSVVNDCRPTDLPSATTPNSSSIPNSASLPNRTVHPGCSCPWTSIPLPPL